MQITTNSYSDMFGDQIMESKLEAVMAMAALLQGPIEVGNMILAREGVVEILLAMTEGGDPVHVVSGGKGAWFAGLGA